MKEVLTRPVPKVPALLDKTVALLFYEPSTRTRASFEMAAKALSANVTTLQLQGSSAQKGESLKDAAKTLEAIGADAIVIRHNAAGSPDLMARNVKGSVINAGDGAHAHPTQALLDLLTLRERKKDIRGLKVAIVGDISHSRVARSNIWGFTRMGAEVTLVAPKPFLPMGIETLPVHVSYSLDEVLPAMDVIYLLRIQLERGAGSWLPSLEEYVRFYGITVPRMKRAKKDVIVMHPGPINRGVEIEAAVADGPYTVILDQVQNGVATRMAVLYLLLGGEKSSTGGIT
jgi:aspartate carbamoyltransferase catalytic subunit